MSTADHNDLAALVNAAVPSELVERIEDEEIEAGAERAADLLSEDECEGCGCLFTASELAAHTCEGTPVLDWDTVDAIFEAETLNRLIDRAHR